MSEKMPTDYESYRQIMDDLLQPISEEGLDVDTLKRLYESKLIYLENLRVKCFWEMNSPQTAHFSQKDYELIYRAKILTRRHLHDLIYLAVSTSLNTRCF